MILSGETIRKLGIVRPCSERTVLHGLSYGVGPASYDFRIAEVVDLAPGEFMLGSAIEEIRMPLNVCAEIKDKSTLARLGLSLFNTWTDPGFYGNLTLELSNRGPDRIRLPAGAPIGQLVFKFTDAPCVGYSGKYQGQGAAPVAAIFEQEDDGA